MLWPPARTIAPATPPPWRRSVLAAFAIASTSSLVMSACRTSISAISAEGIAPRGASDERAGFARCGRHRADAVHPPLRGGASRSRRARRLRDADGRATCAACERRSRPSEPPHLGGHGLGKDDAPQCAVRLHRGGGAG